MYDHHRGGLPRGRLRSDDDFGARFWRPIARFVYNNPIYTAVILYALVVSITHLRTRGQSMGPFVWQVHGANPLQKGSCFCSRVDDYCLCTPSLAIDTVLEYRETRDGPVTALAFVKRKDGRGMAAVGGFCKIGETLEQAVAREVKEETGANPYDLRLLGVYSRPDRDDRRHTVSATYVASITGRVQAGDDAKEVALIPLKILNIDMIKLAFDHSDFLKDYFAKGFEGSPRVGTSLCPIADRRGAAGVGGDGET